MSVSCKVMPGSAERYLKGGGLNSPHISYTEYRGLGRPDGELGTDGDIYLDEVNTTLYVHSGTWKDDWTLDGRCSHPQLKTYFLWFNVHTANSIGWYGTKSMTDLRYKTRRAGGSDVVPNIDRAIELTLEKPLPDKIYQRAKRRFGKRSENPRPNKKVKITRASDSDQSKRTSSSSPVASSLSLPQLDPQILAISELCKAFSLSMI